MKHFTHPLPIGALVLAVLLACGLGEKKEEFEALAEELKTKAEAFEESVSGDSLSPAETLEKLGEVFGAGEDFVPIDVESMRAAFPRRIMDLELKDTDTKQSTMGALKFTETTGQYASSDGSQTLVLKYADYGTLSGMMAFVAAWSMLNMEERTDDSFERTGKTDDDYPVREKFRKMDGDMGNGERDVVVEERVVVSANGRNVTWETIEEASEKGTDEARKLVKKAS